jgi:hypothetical protein
MSLRAIADESKGVILEVVLELWERPVIALVYYLLRTRKIKRLHAPHKLYAYMSEEYDGRCTKKYNSTCAGTARAGAGIVARANEYDRTQAGLDAVAVTTRAAWRSA